MVLKKSMGVNVTTKSINLVKLIIEGIIAPELTMFIRNTWRCPRQPQVTKLQEILKG